MRVFRNTGCLDPDGVWNVKSQLPVASDDDTRDRRLRWLAIGGIFVLLMGVGVVISLIERFFDPWFFAMIAAPVIGVELGVLGRHLLRSATIWLARRRK
jgi:hypothetical protein